ncbi:MAG: LURP-one-related family protein, partial [Erysipelotrichaceae bacterium]|nr:LURP-one-related family protein [Erysipelotrichaceae bacterium]
MGLFDKLAELGEQLNQAANDISKSTITDYGEPVYSLYTARDLTDIHWRINVTDEQEDLKYYTKSSFFQLKGETDIMDAEDRVIAHLEKKPFSLHEIHYVQMANGQEITLSNELFHVVDDITNIEELGWQMRGNFLSLNFNLVDQKEEPLATVSRKMVSLHDKYCIGIYQPQYEDLIVAIVIQLEKMLEDRRQ